MAQDESLQAQNEKTQNGPVGVEEYAGSEREKPEWACWRDGVCRLRTRKTRTSLLVQRNMQVQNEKSQNGPVGVEEFAGSE